MCSKIKNTMAKIYDLPEGFTAPRFDFSDMKGYREKEEAFINQLKDWCIKRAEGSGQENIGEVIDFPVADGKALYMVAAVKPVQLIHIPIGDCWSYQMAHRITRKDIKDMVERNKRLKELFSKKS